MQRFSRKRQAIIECLAGTDAHPSAEWIYNELKPSYPDLSLATVYRNLKELCEAGDVTSVGTVDGHERFDGCTEPHVHAVCTACGRVTDLWDVPIPEKTVKQAKNAAHFADAVPSLMIIGICEECAGK